MQSISNGFITRLTDNKECEYSIVNSTDGVYPTKLNTQWQTQLFDMALSLKRNSPSKKDFIHGLSASGITDFHWDWEKIVNSPSEFGYETKTFYFLVFGEPQGVLHALFPKESRLSVGDNLVYVDRIAVAPWNRPTAKPQNFKGIGSLLMVFIQGFSESKGYGGAIGLHALEQARTFYTYFGMQSLGIDQAYEGLEYFEMPTGNMKQTAEESFT